MKTIKIKKTVSIAEHNPSGCLLINGRWVIDYTDEDIITGGQDNYRDYADIVDEGDEGYDADDFEQEHDEDYTVYDREVEIEVEVEDDIEEQYEEYKSNAQDNRNSYYGYCMNGGGGKKEFSKMYGNGDIMSFEEFVLS